MRIKLTLPVIVLFSFVVFYAYEHLSISQLSEKEVLRKSYLQRVKQHSEPFRKNSSTEVKEDNPDVSVIRDYIMTQDVNSGAVPMKKFRETYKNIKFNKQLFRSEEEGYDFEWKQIPTNLSGRTRSFLIDPGKSDKLWAGSVTGGLWVRDEINDISSEWTPAEGPWENLSVSKIVADPGNPDNFYMGTGESFTAVSMYRESSGIGSGIWRTKDGGSSWEQIPGTEDFAYINDIVVRRENDKSVLYVAVASGSYKGQDFDSTPSDGLFRSEDDGSTWTQVLPSFVNGAPPAVSDIELTGDNRLYIGTMRNKNFEGGSNVLYSDNGLDWMFTLESEGFTGETYVGGRVLIKSAPSNPDRVYIIRTATIDGTPEVVERNIYRDSEIEIRQTFDAGETWSAIPLPTVAQFSNIPWHALALTVHPRNENHLLIGALNIFSMDNTHEVGSELISPEWRIHSIWTGEIFAKSRPDQKEEFLGLYVHADIHQLEFADEEGSELIVSTDGGIYRTTTFDRYYKSNKESTELNSFNFQGPVFSEFNKGMATGQYYAIDLHPTVTKVMGGTQDNGTLQYNGGPIDVFNQVSGGDGGIPHYDKNQPILISSIYHNAFYFSIGKTNIGRNFDFYPSGNFVNATDYDDRLKFLYANGHILDGVESPEDPLNDQLMIYDINSVINGTNRNGDSRYFANVTSAESPYSVIKVSPYSPENSTDLFIGTQTGRIFKVSGLPYNNPSSIELNSTELPVGFISSIDVGRNEDHLLVTFTNYNTESVWLTRDGGDSWENVERNLPDFPVRWGIFNENNYENVILATEDGIWYNTDLSDGSQEWRQMDGFPHVRVDMIKMKKVDRVLAAGTHGRGLFLGKIPEALDLEEPIISSVKTFDEDELTVYPNPVEDEFTITYTNTENVPVSIDLYDLNGRMVKHLFDGKTNKDFNRRIPAHDLKQGTYVLVLNKGSRKTSLKILKK